MTARGAPCHPGKARRGDGGENLAFACFHCNWHKGSNLASLDPANPGGPVALYHPRRDRWTEHFRVEGARVVPLSEVGRVTATVLRLNAPERVQVRLVLQEAGRWPA